MCKIGLFLLPYIPEAGDLTGFLFRASRDSQTVLCFFFFWWVAVREVLHMKEHTAGFNRLICSFCLFSALSVLGSDCVRVRVCVRAGACVCLSRSGKFAVCDESPQQYRQIWASRNVGSAQIAWLFLCIMMKTRAPVSQWRSATDTSEKQSKRMHNGARGGNEPALVKARHCWGLKPLCGTSNEGILCVSTEWWGSAR